jgi:hypothetical protein
MGFCEQHGFANPCPRCTKNSRKVSAELARLREECESLRAALRPFAEGRASYGSLSNEVGYDHYISVECRESDVCRAAAALKGEPCP